MLVGFAARLRETLRAGDALLRWGGEEFLAVLPGAESHDAVQRLEKMLYECLVFKPDGVSLTFSAGIAERRDDASSTPEVLVALADRRMYEAKTAGRATVVAGEIAQADSDLPGGVFPGKESTLTQEHDQTVAVGMRDGRENGQ